MSLSEKQSKFAVLVAKLILFADAQGYRVTFGEAYRSPDEAKRLAAQGKGITTSLHTLRLAVDLNLFVDGEYQITSDAYAPLGKWWEAQTTDDLECCWGGRFTTLADGNHFSVAHDGRK